MAKLSIYLPDALAARLRGRRNTSGVIQQALERLFADERRRPFARPDTARDQLQAVTERLAAGAQQSYQAGYQAAVARLADLPWDVVDQLAAHGFGSIEEPETWFEHPETWRLEGPEAPWERPVAEDIGEWNDALGQYVPKTPTFRRGYVDALADAHRAVVSGELGATSDEDEGES